MLLQSGLRSIRRHAAMPWPLAEAHRAHQRSAIVRSAIRPASSSRARQVCGTDTLPCQYDRGGGVCTILPTRVAPPMARQSRLSRRPGTAAETGPYRRLSRHRVHQSTSNLYGLAIRAAVCAPIPRRQPGRSWHQVPEKPRRKDRSARDVRFCQTLHAGSAMHRAMMPGQEHRPLKRPLLGPRPILPVLRRPLPWQQYVRRAIR